MNWFLYDICGLCEADLDFFENKTSKIFESLGEDSFEDFKSYILNKKVSELDVNDFFEFLYTKVSEKIKEDYGIKSSDIAWGCNCLTSYFNVKQIEWNSENESLEDFMERIQEEEENGADIHLDDILSRSFVVEVEGKKIEFEFEEKFLDYISDKLGVEDFDIVKMEQSGQASFIVYVSSEEFEEETKRYELHSFDYELSEKQLEYIKKVANGEE